MGRRCIETEVMKLFETNDLLLLPLGKEVGWSLLPAECEGDNAGPELFKVLYADNDRKDFDECELDLVETG